MASEPNSAWVYHRVYVDAGFEAIEHLVVEVLPRIVDDARVSRWFFLRFLDEDGLHLRLRLRAADPEALAARVEPVLIAGVSAADRAAPGAYRPTIVPPPELATPYLRSSRPADARVVRTPYEPEIDRFGVRGIAIAERLFEASSRAALDVLVDERDGGRGRKALAPALMAAVASAFGQHAPAFWDDYAAYWLDPVPGLLAKWRPRFVAKAGELEARGATVLATGASPIVDRWSLAVQAAAYDFGATRERPPRELAFHLIHLMNNRLGLMPIEEAYFATLIGHAAAAEAA